MRDTRYRYRHPLRRFRSPDLRPGRRPGGGRVEAPPPCLFAARLAALTAQDERGRAAFQAVAAAVLKTLETVYRHERAVAAAAVTLAHHEKFAAMTASTEACLAALRQMLTAHGARVVDRREAPAETPESLWWFVLTGALQAHEAGIRQVSALVAAQPRKSAARTLGGIVVQLLHNHYNTLLAEAEQWMG